MSHFLYVHSDLTGDPDVWKVGVAITPYSAVRARQKFCWKQFKLDYLWFGFPGHIAFLEERIKHDLYDLSGKAIQNFGTQTEIFQINISTLRKKIKSLIEEHQLCVEEIVLDEPYTASNSGQCPFGIPGEKYAHGWLQKKARKQWPSKAHDINQRVFLTDKQFNNFFITC